MDYTWIIVLGLAVGLGLVVRLAKAGKLKIPQNEKRKKDTVEDDRCKLYGCTLCTKWFPSIDDLKEHSLEEHKVVVSVRDANYKVKITDQETYEELMLQQAERSQLEAVLEEAEMERIQAKLGQDIIMDRAIVIQDGSTPASVCTQIISKLQEADIEEQFNGTIQSNIRGSQIFFRAELILPNNTENLNAITQFAGAVKR
jgi:hypothetical protein